MENSCGYMIERLLNYGIRKGMLEELDRSVVRNGLMELFGETEAFDQVSWRKQLMELAEKDEKEESPTEILALLLDIGAERGLIPMNTVTYRDLLDAKIMGLLMPRQSELSKKFFQIYEEEGPRKATDYYYELSKASNYIRMDRIRKNWVWTADTKNGPLEITINLSKPEKDPREIANQKLIKSSGYPKCLLCAENPGFPGNLNHPARQNLRIIPFKAAGENWYLQYSPYSYYEEHCILLHEDHIPMKISDKTFTRLLDFIEAFPAYFVGSNADLPIVGGSILSHEHYQGGRHLFPLDSSRRVKEYLDPENKGVMLYQMDWALSTVQVEGTEKAAVEAAAVKILHSWRAYSDEEREILAHTAEPHNTVTPIARRGANGTYLLNLILRNNRTSEEHPDGIFHVHKERQHLKKENIGLIEAMGLAVLPSRLTMELEPMIQTLMGAAYTGSPIHEPWMREILMDYPKPMTKSEAEETMRKKVAERFSDILEDCGVFKKTAAGEVGFQKFMEKSGFFPR